MSRASKTLLFYMFAVMIGMSGLGAMQTLAAMLGAAFILDGLE